MATGQPTVEYRSLPGHPGYRVGNDGSVWSCRRRVRLRGARGGTFVQFDGPWKRLTPVPNHEGRLRVKLSSDRRFHSVGRLVLLAFVGPCPEGMEACHFPDPDFRNNSTTNLRWDTHAANLSDRLAHGTAVRGESHPAATITEQVVREIRAKHTGEFGCGTRLAAEYGVSKAVVSSIHRRRTWKHVV